MRRWAQMMDAARQANYTPQARDSFIAATALAHDLTIVTRNKTDFVQLGVPVLNPWTP